MRRTVRIPLILVLVALTTGCNPSTGADGDGKADEAKLVAPPTELVGKWRLEVADGKTTRTTVYHFMKDGSVKIDVRLDSPDLKVNDRVKRAVIKAENDRITVVDLSRISAEGVEDVLPAERRRPKTLQYQVKGDELRWTEVDKDGKPVQGAKPSVLKKVKE